MKIFMIAIQPTSAVSVAKLCRKGTQRASHMTRVASPSRSILRLGPEARRPELVVFDLDYTLWPFWCEMYTVADDPRLYPESMAVLDALREAEVLMAVASRTPTPKVGAAFMRKLGLEKYFVSTQLIPASSGFDHATAQKDKCHFPAIKRETGIDYQDMLFFDDESKNVQKVARLGCTSILVPTSSGMTMALLRAGLQQHDRNKQSIAD